MSFAEGVVTPKPANDNPLPTQVRYSDVVYPGLQWPCAAGAGGTPTLYQAAFREGRAQLGLLAWTERPPNPSEFPLTLAHGRILAQQDRDAVIAEEDGANRITRDELLVIHSVDATEPEIEDGNAIVAVTDTGKRHFGVAKVSDMVFPGMIALTTLFGALASEIQASTSPDPMNHLPRLTAKRVRVEKLGATDA